MADAGPDPEAWRDRLGRVGVWTGQLDYSTAAVVRETAREVEATGFRALWTGEAVGREVLTAAQLLLASTDSLIVATGIANIWARDALATAAGQLALGEAYPDRFILGIGVSHKPLLDVRGEDYRTPLTFMREYLDGMDHGYDVYRAVQPASRPPRLLAALGPKMLALAGERADGAHTYFVPPEHTAVAREVLGPDRLLVPEQVCVLSEDPAVAREIARRHTTSYLRLPNYTSNLQRFGFEPEDFADGGNDRLVDTICVWGSVDAVAARIKAHLDAGADHVAVQVLVDDRRGLPRREWQELAPALVSL
ncbi:MAG TPA: LLM class F420-dependent oxidoreductase [Mycobacteriales bacterium]|nr:LLM class F420-dependent oxidoreductase [Mycobacteriales bacterium]HVX70371.1 LLM class F420-dependent oxidoreductase [Mycobacteriales bacterium]